MKCRPTYDQRYPLHVHPSILLQIAYAACGDFSTWHTLSKLLIQSQLLSDFCRLLPIRQAILDQSPHLDYDSLPPFPDTIPLLPLTLHVLPLLLRHFLRLASFKRLQSIHDIRSLGFESRDVVDQISGRKSIVERRERAA
jgi:hypothetical protein